MNKLILSFSLLFSVISIVAIAGPKTAKNVVEEIYQSHLVKMNTAKPLPTNLVFSASLAKLMKENDQLCKKNAGTDICGWNAHGDILLNAQEVDPKLNYTNSKITISEKKNGIVQVSLNVYPSLKKHKKAYDRSLTYLMVQENGGWVVDDIDYHTQTLRKQINEENNSFRKGSSSLVN